jgi:peptidoglycan/xylan/chitin deacetylase (PgdA/CDA1 family)
MSMVLRTLFNLMSPRGPRGRLSVLIFHRVLREPDPLLPGEMHAQHFDRVCRWLAQWLQVLPLEKAVQRLRDGSLPARAAAITFDDGYADNHDVALPILQRHGLTATFFVATGFLDGGRMWNDTVIESLRRARSDSLNLQTLGLPGVTCVDLGSLGARQAAVDRLLGAIKYLGPAQRQAAVNAVATAAAAELPRDLMLTSEQLRQLAEAGMGIGAHTVSHPILASLPPEAALDEVARSKQTLEELLQRPVPLFAYPNGKPHQDYSPQTLDVVRSCGFSAAFSTAWGAARPGDDLFQLPRFTPWDQGRSRFGLRLLRNFTTPVSGVGGTPEFSLG